jgi:hypothetical protein
MKQNSPLTEVDPPSPNHLKKQEGFLRWWSPKAGKPWFLHSNDVVEVEADHFQELRGSKKDRTRQGALGLFGRSLPSFPNGTLLSKQCGPWGRLEVLKERKFLLKQKFVDSWGDMRGAIISPVLMEGVDLFIGAEFHDGWATDAHVEEYREYHGEKNC